MGNYSKHFLAVFFVFVRMMILLLEPKKNQMVNAVTKDEKGNTTYVGPNICATRSTTLEEPYTYVPRYICATVDWKGYDIAFKQDKDHVVTVVLVGLYLGNWLGVAVSQNGKMVGSSAVVGWLRGTESNSSVIRQYEADGKEGKQVKPDKGKLKLGKAAPTMVKENDTIYLAFQIEFNEPLRSQPFLFAAGNGKPGQDDILPNHVYRTAMVVDFHKGTVSMGVDNKKEKTNHGILAVVGWGIITPLGVAFARYFRHREPLWYYLHSTVQFVGFFVGLAAAAVGKSLYDRTEPKDYAYHKGIGYLVLAFSVLQVCQFVVRPGSSSSVRHYWNLSHYWVGSVTIVLAPVNVVIGLYGKDGGDRSLKILFFSVFGLLVVGSIYLEIRRVMIKRKSTTNSDLTADLTQPPIFQANKE